MPAASCWRHAAHLQPVTCWSHIEATYAFGSLQEQQSRQRLPRRRTGCQPMWTLAQPHCRLHGPRQAVARQQMWLCLSSWRLTPRLGLQLRQAPRRPMPCLAARAATLAAAGSHSCIEAEAAATIHRGAAAGVLTAVAAAGVSCTRAICLRTCSLPGICCLSVGILGGAVRLFIDVSIQRSRGLWPHAPSTLQHLLPRGGVRNWTQGVGCTQGAPGFRGLAHRLAAAASRPQAAEHTIPCSQQGACNNSNFSRCIRQSNERCGLCQQLPAMMCADSLCYPNEGAL